MSLGGFKKISLMQGDAFVSITNNATAFSKNVVLKMKSPEHIVVLFNEETCQIAIQACDGTDSDSIPFLKKGKKAANGARTNNRELQNSLARRMNWDIENNIYRISGVYYDEDQAMIFDLKDARPMQKKKKNK